MRTLLLLTLVLTSLSIVSAQRGRGPNLTGVWLETSLDRYGEPLPVDQQPRRTTLILDADGYFEEIRPGRTRYSPQRRFLGRWDADYRYGELNLVVGQQGRVATTPYDYRYRGRTQRIPYAIVYSDRDELVLRDRRNGRKRFFVRE